MTVARGIIEVSGLSRSWRRHGVAALADVSFSVRPGEVFGIVGDSGSGKSTLARILVALDRPTSGSVLFDGVELTRLRGRRLRRMRTRFQLVFQDPLTTADPRWTARATIDEALAVRGGRRDVVRLSEVVHQVDLDPEVLGRRPHALSGGERQRVALARALAVDPDLVVLDEAFTALDTVTRKALLSNLLAWRARKAATLIVISHDLRLVAAIADRALVLEKGRVRAIGPAQDLVRSIPRPGAAPEEPQVP
jgi:peptide/nickel transport system ATP-binding protein